MITTEPRIDALLPAEMARRAEYVGVTKAEASTFSMFSLAILAGVYIALGAVFATTVSAGTAGDWPYGVSRLLSGVVFCLGLILVVVGGAELFTGNNLIAMAWASRKVTTRSMMRNWIVVYFGNLVGSLVIAFLMLGSQQHTFGGGAVGITALGIANAKVGLEFWQAISLGILCNALVCMAVWLTYSARSTVDKIAAIVFPITAFVAAGFEHSVANMYFIPMGLLIKAFDPAFAAASGLDLGGLTWGSFVVDNLIPVTIGNIIGGTVLVAAVYWMVFLGGKKSPIGSATGSSGSGR
jgi:formate transporter